MIRLKISNFIRKHKKKIKDLTQKVIMVAVGVFIATIILSTFTNDGGDKTDNNQVANVYKPTETVIKGSNVSQEQYEEDKNLVNTFLEYCNNGKIEEAYNLVSDECKEEKYPTIEKFKQYYYNNVFEEKRECNLQSWISNSNYTVYQVRYTNSMLSTGMYDENNVYQDYITLKRKDNIEKISIGNFVDFKNMNVTTKTDELEVTVKRKMQYISYEEYKLSIKNKTDKTILLNNLKSNASIKLLSSSGVPYTADINRLFINNLVISKNEEKEITLRFMKQFSSNNDSKEIELTNIIKDYKTYIKNEREYNDVTSITVKVVD